MQRAYDAIIVGARCAGSPTAMLLARKGYYKSLVGKFGQMTIDGSVRFYLVPGYSHFGGLSFNATQGLPAFSALEAWVEGGMAPGTLVATDVNPDAHGRTRPMCVYPAWPRYKGSGDVASAGSFACVAE